MNNKMSSRFSKTCDDCKSRKVRCLKQEDPGAKSCLVFTKRNVTCHFSTNKRRRWRDQKSTPVFVHSTSLLDLDEPPSLSLIADKDITSHDNAALPNAKNYAAPAKLYIDHILHDRQMRGRGGEEVSIFKAREVDVGVSGLAFFSEKRISSVSKRLGHTKFRDCIDNITAAIGSRMSQNNTSLGSIIKFSGLSPVVQLKSNIAKSYISAYFTYVHPLYPFLNRKKFEEKAFSAEQAEHQMSNSHFSALYHSVLALGCQYHEGGGFGSRNGLAWKLFQISLGLVSEILVPKERLINVQAITAMAIFAQNSSCIQIEKTLISEAARMAQLLSLNKRASHVEDEIEHHRTFWVIYILEKMASFVCGKASILVDYDIGCPIPETPDSIVEGFDWFLCMIHFSRLISRAYEILFSTSASLNSVDQLQIGLSSVHADLEFWRESIPEHFRPGQPFNSLRYSDHLSKAVVLRSHLLYHKVVIALSRLSLNNELDSSSTGPQNSKEVLLNAARVVIELTRYIDTELHAPVWIWGSMPLLALFVIFDFVIHNPTHPETSNNLSLLSIAAGYFCRLEYASVGSLPSSLLSEFNHIAGQHVRDTDCMLKNDTAKTTKKCSSSQRSTMVQSAPQGSGGLPLTSMHNIPYDSLLDPPSAENFVYPIDGSFPMGKGMLSTDTIDILNFFDHIIMDERSQVEWTNHML